MLLLANVSGIVIGYFLLKRSFDTKFDYIRDISRGLESRWVQLNGIEARVKGMVSSLNEDQIDEERIEEIEKKLKEQDKNLSNIKIPKPPKPPNLENYATKDDLKLLEDSIDQITQYINQQIERKRAIQSKTLSH